VKKLADKTIKELADELGVSKQAVWQKIKKKSSTDLRQFTSTKGNTVYVSVDGQKIIKSMFEKDSSTKSSTKSSTNSLYLDDNELTFLRELVHDLQNEKKELYKLLDQQQQLTLQANKQIERLEAQERLTDVPGEEVNQEPQPDPKTYKTPEEAVKATDVYFDAEGFKKYMDKRARKNKKWWHFFRKEP
jgi:predicted DNA-binding protein YlxM (UPF0122 family)